MSSSFITNKDKFLSDIINGILPKTDAVDFLVSYFYYSGYVQLSENLKSKHIRILVGLDIEIQISKHVCDCGIDVNGHAVLNSAFMVIAHSINYYALLGLLNSEVLKYYWSRKFEDKRKAFPKIKGSYIEQLPIKKINNDYFNSLVKRIVSMRKGGDNCVKEINEMNLMVYKLYGLTYDEVKVVDPETTITEEEYEREISKQL